MIYIENATECICQKVDLTLRELFTYIVFDIIFIKYTDYVVMVVLESRFR